jgi:hypothetical protein
MSSIKTELTKKEIRKQKQSDIQFIISAVTTELHDKAYYYYNETWEANGGMGWFFNECIDITHKIMLTKGSPYLKWLENWIENGGHKYCKDFSSFVEESKTYNCFDWYHMTEALKEFESRYEKDEDASLKESLKVDYVIANLKEMNVNGETLEHIITEIGMDEQMFRQLIKNEKPYSK